MLQLGHTNGKGVSPMVKLKKYRVLVGLSRVLLISVLMLPVFFSGGAEASSQAEAMVVDSIQKRQLFDVPKRWPDRNEIMALMSKRYGIRFTSLMKFCAAGGRLDEACHIAHIAMLSNKSFDSIVSLKHGDNSWTEVFHKAGISEDVIRTYRKNIAADMLKLRYGIDHEISFALIDECYRLGDISRAAQLAVLAKMDVREVLGMKQINNSWDDVAKLLDVSFDA